MVSVGQKLRLTTSCGHGAQRCCAPTWISMYSSQVFGFDGEAADALAGGGKDGVADGRGDDREARFPDAGWFFGALHDVNFDFRSFVDARHLVIVEVGLFDAAFVDGDRIFHEGGDTIDGGAFDLRFDSVGIDGAAAIDGVDDALDVELAVFQ